MSMALWNRLNKLELIYQFMNGHAHLAHSRFHLPEVDVLAGCAVPTCHQDGTKDKNGYATGGQSVIHCTSSG